MVELLCESMGIRAVSRITGLHRDTVLSILETVGQKAAVFLDANVRNVKAEQIQADEIHTICGCKAVTAELDDLERGDFFTYLAVDRRSKLIISSLAGKRTRENTLAFLDDLRNRVDGRFQLTTDAAQIYGGSAGSVSRVFGGSIDYATETKRFAAPLHFVPRRVIGIRRIRCIGEPDMKMATTCHCERTNLSVRLFNRRFTRCTLGFSKKPDNLRHAVALFVWHFNFARVHSAHRKTPAQAAGITDHAWTIEELLTATN